MPSPLKKIKNVKKLHGIIDERCLRPLAQLPGVKKVLPGEISWRKKTSAVASGLYFQRVVPTGIKMAIKKNMYVQDVYVLVTADFKIELLRSVVQNPNKLVL